MYKTNSLRNYVPWTIDIFAAQRDDNVIFASFQLPFPYLHFRWASKSVAERNWRGRKETQMVVAVIRSRSSLDFRVPALGECRSIYFFVYIEINEYSILLFASKIWFLLQSFFLREKEKKHKWSLPSFASSIKFTQLCIRSSYDKLRTNSYVKFQEILHSLF